MEHGSLHDLLHNETMAIEGESILPILRDLTSGMRFLHSADPQILHGDLKVSSSRASMGVGIVAVIFSVLLQYYSLSTSVQVP